MRAFNNIQSISDICKLEKLERLDISDNPIKLSSDSDNISQLKEDLGLNSESLPKNLEMVVRDDDTFLIFGDILNVEKTSTISF